MVDALLQVLSEGNGREVSGAADTLALIGEKAIPRLIETLESGNARMRHNVKQVFLRLRPSEATLLIPYLGTCSKTTYRVIVRVLALTWRQEVERFEPLIKSADPRVRSAGIDALGQTETAEFVSELEDLLDDTSEVAGFDERVCDKAVKSLLRIGTQNAVNAVEVWRIRAAE
ncbi:MAG: HEAT repeat domain-containing protein [Chloroflexi bacterium]|nr:HEAT repeat domain-containing protein [Chloroflexota bacterium]